MEMLERLSWLLIVTVLVFGIVTAVSADDSLTPAKALLIELDAAEQNGMEYKLDVFGAALDDAHGAVQKRTELDNRHLRRIPRTYHKL